MRVKKWEYLVRDVDLMTAGPELHLDVIGEDGWELVSVGHTGGDAVCVFKRATGYVDAPEDES